MSRHLKKKMRARLLQEAFIYIKVYGPATAKTISEHINKKRKRGCASSFRLCNYFASDKRFVEVDKVRAKTYGNRGKVILWGLVEDV